MQYSSQQIVRGGVGPIWTLLNQADSIAPQPAKAPPCADMSGRNDGCILPRRTCLLALPQALPGHCRCPLNAALGTHLHTAWTWRRVALHCNPHLPSVPYRCHRASAPQRRLPRRTVAGPALCQAAAAAQPQHRCALLAPPHKIRHTPTIAQRRTSAPSSPPCRASAHIKHSDTRFPFDVVSSSSTLRLTPPHGHAFNRLARHTPSPSPTPRPKKYPHMVAPQPHPLSHSTCS